MKYLIFSFFLVCIYSCRPSAEEGAGPENQEIDFFEESALFLQHILTDTTEEAFIQDQYYVLSDIDQLLPPPHMEEETSEPDFVAASLQEEDEGFIHEQLSLQEDFSTRVISRQEFTIVPLRQMLREHTSPDSLWSSINGRYEHGFYSVSMPVFSKDMQKAYVRLGHLCGVYCGGGETRIYQREGGDWKLSEVVEVWVH